MQYQRKLRFPLGCRRRAVHIMYIQMKMLQRVYKIPRVGRENTLHKGWGWGCGRMRGRRHSPGGATDGVCPQANSGN